MQPGYTKNRTSKKDKINKIYLELRKTTLYLIEKYKI